MVLDEPLGPAPQRGSLYERTPDPEDCAPARYAALVRGVTSGADQPKDWPPHLSGDQGMIVWWSIGAGVHVEPHSHINEQIVWMLTGKMEFWLGAEQRVCGRGDVVVISRDVEHEACFREDTEVIGFFAPPRDDFLHGGKPPT